MTYEILWKLFIKTGDIKYYNLLIELKRSDEFGRRESKEDTKR